MLYAKRAHMVTLKFRNRGSLSFSTYHDPERKKDVLRIGKPDVRKWLDRVRRQYRIRYMLAPEFGPATGRLHYHALLCFEDVYPTTDWVRARWKQGHCHNKLAGSGDAGYVAKYATKEPGSRVWASVSYGTSRADRLAKELNNDPFVTAVKNAFDLPKTQPAYLVRRAGNTTGIPYLSRGLLRDAFQRLSSPAPTTRNKYLLAKAGALPDRQGDDS